VSSNNVRQEKSQPSASTPSKLAEKTIIGEEISIKGTINGRGNLIIQGAIQGNINLDQHHLTIGPNGNVEAEVTAENVTISGRLKGNINAKGKVEITKTADFNGEIKAKRISVEDGAFLKAVIELQRNSPSAATKPVTPISKESNIKAAPPK
jgi:cytoskeletal protein CcmA (bactofilin family)